MPLADHAPPRPHHLALVGPTASGKSSLALALARQRSDVELVCVDSMTVYVGMDVGTAKPSPDDRASVPHHLLDIADPAEDFSVVRFAEAARRAIASIEARAHVAVLVGGAGLYLQAAIGDVDPPGQWPEVRAELEAMVESHQPSTMGGAAVAELHARLADVDPVAASRMEPTNRRRVLRALEVTLGSGRPFSSFGPGMTAFPAVAFSLVGVALPTSVVGARIEQRVARMAAAGLVDEVQRLRTRPQGLGRTARQALGYKEVLAHLEAGADLDDCLAVTVRRTRGFARRQRAWFRRDPRIQWLAIDENPEALLPDLLRELDRCRH